MQIFFLLLLLTRTVLYVFYHQHQLFMSLEKKELVNRLHATYL